jgi:hypothetical protein
MSSDEGKSWIKERIGLLAAPGPLAIVDVGPGVGTYAKLLAGPDVKRMVGIEVWEPYVRTYRLHDYYDELIIGDVRTVPIPATDVVILGDVAEHMTADEALSVRSTCPFPSCTTPSSPSRTTRTRSMSRRTGLTTGYWPVFPGSGRRGRVRRSECTNAAPAEARSGPATGWATVFRGSRCPESVVPGGLAGRTGRRPVTARRYRRPPRTDGTG